MLTVILILTAVFIYYLYFKQKYGYWERRGESQNEFIELFLVAIYKSTIVDSNPI